MHILHGLIYRMHRFMARSAGERSRESLGEREARQKQQRERQFDKGEWDAKTGSYNV